ncbi:MAG: glycine cleavage system protein GcvH [Opitutae bacterium]|nr:glycine cleavage system protein GcvH [Opitutae bacterium]
MNNIPDELKYSTDHEWLRLLDDGTAQVGITDFAQSRLGDITFVELPEEGEDFAKGESFCVVESVKAASDVYLMAAGEILEINSALEDEPELINQDAYGEGWIVKIRLAGRTDLDDLLSARDYARSIA